MPKILSAHDAVRQYIHDGDTVTFGGFASGLMHPESILRALEERARNGEGPHGLTALYAAGQGDSDSRGLNHLGVEGLCRRVIGGHWGLSPKLGRLCAENKLAGYNLPQGVIAQLFRDIAAGKPGVITHVGLGTFVDPRLEGGKLNDAARAAGDVVKLIELEGEEKLFYPAIPIQVAILRASYADTRGNCTFQREGVYALPLEGAVAPGIGIAGPENSHLNGNGRVEQLFLPLQLNELYHVPGRPGGVVELAPLQAGVYKGAQAHMGNYARLSRGNVPEKLGDHPLGQVVAGQLVFRAQPAQLGGEPPVAADHPAAKALHPQVVQAAAVAVALTGGVQGGQAVGPLAVSRPLLQRSENGLRMHQAAGEAAEGDGVSVVDVLAHGIVRRQDFGHICTPFPLTIPPRKEAARVRLVCGPRRCRKYTA